MKECDKAHGTRKYYTPGQANALVPDLQKCITRIHELRDQLEVLDELEVRCETCGSNIMEHNIKLNKQHHKLSYEFFCELEFLQSLGCDIKDLDDGVIDFYSIFEGREILLCWQHGEESIEHWHEVDGGFAGRRPVSILPNEPVDVQSKK